MFIIDKQIKEMCEQRKLIAENYNSDNARKKIILSFNSRNIVVLVQFTYIFIIIVREIKRLILLKEFFKRS